MDAGPIADPPRPRTRHAAAASAAAADAANGHEPSLPSSAASAGASTGGPACADEATPAAAAFLRAARSALAPSSAERAIGSSPTGSRDSAAAEAAAPGSCSALVAAGAAAASELRLVVVAPTASQASLVSEVALPGLRKASGEATVELAGFVTTSRSGSAEFEVSTEKGLPPCVAWARHPAEPPQDWDSPARSVGPPAETGAEAPDSPLRAWGGEGGHDAAAGGAGASRGDTKLAPAPRQAAAAEGPSSTTHRRNRRQSGTSSGTADTDGDRRRVSGAFSIGYAAGATGARLSRGQLAAALVEAAEPSLRSRTASALPRAPPQAEPLASPAQAQRDAVKPPALPVASRAEPSMSSSAAAAAAAAAAARPPAAASSATPAGSTASALPAAGLPSGPPLAASNATPLAASRGGAGHPGPRPSASAAAGARGGGDALRGVTAPTPGGQYRAETAARPSTLRRGASAVRRATSSSASSAAATSPALPGSGDASARPATAGAAAGLAAARAGAAATTGHTSIPLAAAAAAAAAAVPATAAASHQRAVDATPVRQATLSSGGGTPTTTPAAPAAAAAASSREAAMASSLGPARRLASPSRSAGRSVRAAIRDSGSVAEPTEPPTFSAAFYPSNKPCEDHHFAVLHEPSGAAVFGVLDGHGGVAAAEFFTREIPKRIVRVSSARTGIALRAPADCLSVALLPAAQIHATACCEQASESWGRDACAATIWQAAAHCSCLLSWSAWPSCRIRPTVVAMATPLRASRSVCPARHRPAAPAAPGQVYRSQHDPRRGTLRCVSRGGRGVAEQAVAATRPRRSPPVPRSAASLQRAGGGVRHCGGGEGRDSHRGQHWRLQVRSGHGGRARSAHRNGRVGSEALPPSRQDPFQLVSNQGAGTRRGRTALRWCPRPVQALPGSCRGLAAGSGPGASTPACRIVECLPAHTSVRPPHPSPTSPSRQSCRAPPTGVRRRRHAPPALPPAAPLQRRPLAHSRRPPRQSLLESAQQSLLGGMARHPQGPRRAPVPARAWPVAARRLCLACAGLACPGHEQR